MKESTQDMEFNGHRIAVALHDAGGKKIVIFCHGFRSLNIGPNRFFVRAARRLVEMGISSLRFDQYGSGNSEGDFLDSSFHDWVKTAETVAKHYLDKGYKVALFGQSMGGATVIAVGSKMPELSSVVSWVPDPNVDESISHQNGIVEEVGQRVRVRYWEEAREAKIAEKMKEVKAPMYIVQCTADEYVDEENRNAVSNNAMPNHKVEIFEGLRHSKWTYDQAEEIITKSTDFLVENF